jgi:histidinol-phosphatase (PHP family)
MKYFDYHLHNEISFDSEAKLLDQCEEALRKGLSEIALTNHYELDFVLQGTASAPDLVLEEQLLLEAQERFRGRLTIRRGIEIGQPAYDLAAARALMSARDYDVVLGSMHNGLGGLDFYYMRSEDYTDDQLRAIWEDYVNQLLEVATKGEMDVLTHVMYPRRYVEESRRHCFAPTKEQFEPIFRALIQRGIALEINTSAVRRGAAKRPDPELEFLTLCLST